MASQRPYSTLPLSEDSTQQYYQHPAQASQYSLHTPTDPNPPNSSFRSPLSPISPRVPSGQGPPRSPGFSQMESTGAAVGSRRLTRVFDGDESPVDNDRHEQQVNQSQLEYSDVDQGIGYVHQPQGHEQQYQGHEQQYQGHEQQYQDHDQQYQGHQQQQYQGHEQYQQSQPQGQDLHYQQPTDYLPQQGYDARTQVRYSTPLPSPGFPQSQFDPHSQTNSQFALGSSQQYGPSPQYVSPPHSPSFPPPQQSPSFPPQPRSATFRPKNLSFLPPAQSPPFPPHSPSFPPPPLSPSYPPLPQSPVYPPTPGFTPHTPGFTPHTPTFPPPPTSEIYHPSVPIPMIPGSMSSSLPIPIETPPLPAGQGVEMTARPQIPPEPIDTPSHTPGLEGPKTPVYTPGGGSGPNGGTHAPGQIGHPNQQHGKDEYSHGLCDCFSELSTCCMGYWCPCILYSRTNHRLKTSPNSNLNDFHNCNGHCVGFCVLAPVSWIFTLIQRGRIRDKYRLEGTVMSDCGKAYCCVMCTLVQDEREVTDREDERRRNAGPGSGVVGESGYRRNDSMVYG